MESQNQWRSR